MYNQYKNSDCSHETGRKYLYSNSMPLQERPDKGKPKGSDWQSTTCSRERPDRKAELPTPTHGRLSHCHWSCSEPANLLQSQGRESYLVEWTPEGWHSVVSHDVTLWFCWCIDTKVASRQTKQAGAVLDKRLQVPMSAPPHPDDCNFSVWLCYQM